MRNGIQFTNDGQWGRGSVLGYHNSPDFIFKTEGHNVDIAGLKCREPKSAIVTNGNARFRIGIEVEKNSINRSAIKEYALFKGFERDSSCGLEAITHVLPLLPKSAWRSKVFNMFHEAERVIDDSYSPSNYRCGAHVTLSVGGLDSTDLMDLVREYAGIILAVFPLRLANHYCTGNPRLRTDVDPWIFNTKYVVCKNADFGIEFRLPSAIKSVRAMQLRYELFYELVNFAVNHQGKSFGIFLRRVKPIIARMYEGDADKVEQVMTLAKSFQKFIKTGRVSSDIRPYLEGDFLTHRSRTQRDYSEYYDRNCAREQGTQYRARLED
jgi:hypothetical protein